MNNPYQPLSRYFQKNNSYGNIYEKMFRGDKYMMLIKEEEMFKEKFKHASNYNKDNVTTKIGREYPEMYKRIPMEFLMKNDIVKREERERMFQYQKDFWGYDLLNRRIYNLERKPLRKKYNEVNTEEHKCLSKSQEIISNHINKENINNNMLFFKENNDNDNCITHSHSRNGYTEQNRKHNNNNKNSRLMRCSSDILSTPKSSPYPNYSVNMLYPHYMNNCNVINNERPNFSLITYSKRNPYSIKPCKFHTYI